MTVKEYGHILRNDTLYAVKAAHFSAQTQDLNEYLPQLVHALRDKAAAAAQPTLVSHPHCTLRHGKSCT